MFFLDFNMACADAAGHSWDEQEQLVTVNVSQNF